jgi:hypothetical protein
MARQETVYLLYALRFAGTGASELALAVPDGMAPETYRSAIEHSPVLDAIVRDRFAGVPAFAGQPYQIASCQVITEATARTLLPLQDLPSVGQIEANSSRQPA